MSLYKNTLSRVAKSSSSPPTPTKGKRPINLPDFSSLYLNPEVEQEKRKKRIEDLEREEELVALRSVPGTPGNGSRPSSPTKKGRKKKASETSRDPLVRFPEEVKSRIFLLVDDVPTLKKLRLVSRRWRRSATLNYCWFRLFQSTVFSSPPPVTSTPTWTRRESKEDWFARYKSIKRSDSYNGPALADDAAYERARSEGYRTPREEREDRWEAENEGTMTPSKVEMREYYKGLHNSKSKGKGGRQGATRDRTAWEEGDGDF